MANITSNSPLKALLFPDNLQNISPANVLQLRGAPLRRLPGTVAQGPPSRVQAGGLVERPGLRRREAALTQELPAIPGGNGGCGHLRHHRVRSAQDLSQPQKAALAAGKTGWGFKVLRANEVPKLPVLAVIFRGF